MTALPTLRDIEDARARISSHLPVTPVTRALTLSEEFKKTLYIKWDNRLRTGSFKERGALNFLLNLDATTLARGVCAASAGNHALGLSFHASRLGAPCHIVMPANAPLVKMERCKSFGAFITQQSSLSEALTAAQEMAVQNNLTLVPPFDHRHIIHGQGVAGLELLEQLDDFDSVIIPVGGGGYAAGVATAIKSKRPDVFILGVCSEWAVEMRRNPDLHKGGFVPTTIADGIAVKTIGKVTGPVLDSYVDKLVSVSESAIAKAIIMLLEHEHTVVEGAGAASIAALIQGHLPSKYIKPALFVCGSNIDTNLLSRLIEHNMAETGRLLKIGVSLPDRPGMLHTVAGIIAARGANVLQVLHDRFYARLPGYVDITVVMEVRDRAHGLEIITELGRAGLPTQIL
jgi:threonine dehydratase